MRKLKYPCALSVSISREMDRRIRAYCAQTGDTRAEAVRAFLVLAVPEEPLSDARSANLERQ